MNIGAGLKAHLVADAGVNAIVAGRVYPNRVPRTSAIVFPLIWYQCSDQFEHDLASMNRVRSEFDVFCAAEDYDQAHALTDAVQAALHGITGQLGGVGPSLRHCNIVSRNDDEVDVSVDDTYDVVIARFSAMWHG